MKIKILFTPNVRDYVHFQKLKLVNFNDNIKGVENMNKIRTIHTFQNHFFLIVITSLYNTKVTIIKKAKIINRIL